MPTESLIPVKHFSFCEYVVDDFLEVACFLKEDKRRFLIEELRLQGAGGGTLNAYGSFSMAERLVVVIEGPAIQECWLYYPDQGKIEKHLLRRKKA